MEERKCWSQEKEWTVLVVGWSVTKPGPERNGDNDQWIRSGSISEVHPTDMGRHGMHETANALAPGRAEILADHRHWAASTVCHSGFGLRMKKKTTNNEGKQRLATQGSGYVWTTFMKAISKQMHAEMTKARGP